MICLFEAICVNTSLVYILYHLVSRSFIKNIRFSQQKREILETELLAIFTMNY